MTRDLPWFTIPLLVQGSAAAAMPAEPDMNPAQLCRSAIAATERVTRIPDAFLNAISRVESGRPGDGTVNPWPWTVNAAGTGHFYASKAEAIAAVRAFMAQGVRSLDVGCLQVSLLYHKDAFPSLDQAFDPAANAAFAGQFLLTLFQQTGSWPRAAAAYHSQTRALGDAYEKKVLDAWAEPDRPASPRSSTSRVRPDTPPPATPPPSILSAAMAPSDIGFTRRFMLPRAGFATGRSLADYRAFNIRTTLHPPDRRQPLPTLRGG